MVAVRPVDLGFAEFLASLLRETTEAVLSSQADQEEQAAAFVDTAESSIEEFAAALAEEDVAAALADLLPDGAGGTSAVAGGPVPPAGVLRSLGLVLRDDDVDGDGTEAVLTESGAERVRSAVRLSLARSRLAALRAVASRGLPRVLVENGRVLAKVTLCPVRVGDDDEDDDDRDDDDRDDEDDDEDDEDRRRGRCSDRPVVLASPERTPAALRPSLRAGMVTALRDVRLVAHSPTGSEPRPREGVMGEVELTFRTVT